MGECSFCGKRDVEASAFAGLERRVHRICGMCLSLCLEITCEYDKREERETLAATLASLEPRRDLDQRMLEKLESRDFDGLADIIRGMGHGDVDPEDIRAFVETRESSHHCRIDTERRVDRARDACSFCDWSRDKATQLIDGPRASICDRCIDEASADVVSVLHIP